MKKILVIHTGGTIAMQRDDKTGGVNPGEHNPLHQWVHYVGEDILVIPDDYLHLPSPHITPEHMLSLYNHMLMRMREETLDGVVITHGTDTMEETAYLFDLLYDGKMPVIFTGAMRTSDELSSDGPRNFISSINAAANTRSHGKGVLVVMNDEIHAARHVMKVHSSSVAAFQSPISGPIGAATTHDVIYYHQNLPKEHYSVSSLNKKVLLIKVYAGMEESIFEHLVQQPLDGLVIEAFGQGNVPPSILKAIEETIKQNTPVVLVTRSQNGPVQDTYSYQGGGKTLKEAGVIFASGLTGPKARLKLMTILESKRTMDELQTSFQTN